MVGIARPEKVIADCGELTLAIQDKAVLQRRSFLWWAGVVLAVIGLAVSIYLTWIKVTDSTAACSGIGDCESVNNSRYATIAGIPIALLGAGGYAVWLGLLLLESGIQGSAEMPRLIALALSLAGTLYSAYLTYLEVAVLKAICPFCVVSAVAMTGLLIVSALRLKRLDAPVE